MTHISGHIEEYNFNALYFNDYIAQSPTAEETSAAIRNTLPFGILKLANTKEALYLPFFNNLNIKQTQFNEHNREIGFHIFLTIPDFRDTTKFRAFAYDVIPRKLHEDAEKEAVTFLDPKKRIPKAKTFKKVKLEHFVSDDIEELISRPTKPEHKKIFRQSADYLKTPSYDMLYFDNGNPIEEEDALLNFLEKKVVFYKKIARP